MDRRFHRLAVLLTVVILPICLLHTRTGAEIAIVLIDALFLAASAQARSWRWLRQPWLIVALLWWGWEVICSIPLPALGFGAGGWPDFAEAVMLLRFLVLIAAIESWVLVTPASRRAAWLGIALSVLYIGVESWQQYLTGHNIFGDARWPDGSLTGPFWQPRAGAPFAHLLCVALLPVSVPLLAQTARLPRLAGGLLAALALATTILIGQRMPTLLALLALATSCLFIPRLRPAAAIAFGLGVVLLAATPVISPPTYHKLVLHFIYQISRFAVSPYGEIYTRALRMGIMSPWHGYGFNGFKTLCPLPQFAPGFPAFGIAPTQLALAACNIHPHNFYLQALTDAGVPGLLLFAAMNLAWLRGLARGLWRQPEPLRVGLFAGVLTYAWPLASADSFVVLPHVGWLLLMVGLGLATAHLTPSPTALEQNHA
jgi:hypothetical protein